MDDATIVNGFDRFDGVKRRFSRVGEVDGAIIIDDYAHHPVEIRAVLSAARESTQASAEGPGHRGRPAAPLHAGCESLMDDFQNAFNDADIVFVAPVYAAGEEPIEGVDSEALAGGLARPRPPHGPRRCEPRRACPGSARSRRRRAT